MRTLFPVQERALDYARDHKHPAFFLEMRLGKTLPTIRFLQEKHPRGCGLVVAPLSAVPAWRCELEEESEPSIALLLGAVHRRGAALSSGARWNLVNWEGLRVLPELTEVPWDWVVLDESVRIRNPKAQLTQLACRGFRDVGTRVILSGMPAPETDMDYFCQMLFLDGEWWGYKNYWQFRNALFRQAGYDWVPKPGMRERLKEYVRERAFWCSAEEAGMANEVVRIRRYVEPTEAQIALTKAAKTDFALQLSSGERTTRWRPVVETWLARIAGGFVGDEVVSTRKTELLLELLLGELANKKVVVWFRFNLELEQIAKALASSGIGFTFIRGNVEWKEREERRKLFAEASNIQVLLCQIKCASHGVDFSAADYAVYYSMVYAADEQQQTEARVKHPLVRTPRCLVYLLTEGSLDEVVFDSVSQKRAHSAWYRTRLEEFLKGEIP